MVLVIQQSIDFITDDWITQVYQPNRSVKANEISLYHLTDIQRYSVPGWLHLLRVKLLYLPAQIEKDVCSLQT